MRRLPILAAAAAAVVALAGVLALWHGLGAGDANAGLSIGGPFRLVAADGRTVTDRDFRGKWMLVYFGYTHCPDACPTALNDIANALDLLKGRRRDVAPIFITVDPARDTPAVIGRYTALFDPAIVGLTGSQADITRVEREYRVYAARHPEKDGGYSMDHSSIIYVMKPDGQFAGFLDGAASPQDIAAKIEALES